MNIETLLPRDPLLQAFQNIPLFEGLSGDALISLFIAAREDMVHTGEVIVKEGEPGDDLYLIGRGKVQVYKNHGQPNATLIASLGKNEFFGEMCVIEPIVRSATVIAEETSFLYTLNSNSLNKLYQVWPEQHTLMMKNLASNLAHRIEHLAPSFASRAH